MTRKQDAPASPSARQQQREGDPLRESQRRGIEAARQAYEAGRGSYGKEAA